MDPRGLVPRHDCRAGGEQVQPHSRPVRLGTIAKKQEWWHFYYATDVQETFLDEMELVGYSADTLKKAGWTDADLDKPPG